VQDAPAADSTARAAQPAPGSTAYDSIWADGGSTTLPTQAPEPLERAMMADGKIYVVLAVVLIIWLGLLVYLFRTDRRLDRLEARFDEEAAMDGDTASADAPRETASDGEAASDGGAAPARAERSLEANLSRDE
jgi:CcmD family protein